MRWLKQWFARRRLGKDFPIVDFQLVKNAERLRVSYGYPPEWNTCQFCGKGSFGFHPHNEEACPLVESVAESAGMNLEAGAAAQRRAGVQVEEVTRLIRERFGPEGD